MRPIFSLHRWTAASAIALALVMVAPGPLHAQGLLNKAKKALGSKAEQSKTEQLGPPPKFTNTLLELTPDRLDSWLKGVAAGQQVKSKNGLTVMELKERANQCFEKRASLLDGHGDEQSKYDQARYKWDQCVDEALDAIREKKRKDNEAKMQSLDPEMVATLQQKAMEMNQMMAEGDTAGAMKIQRELATRFGDEPTAADSAAARSKCGKPPAKPDWLVKAEEQERLAQKSLDEAREMEESTGKRQAEASDMTPTQYSLANERIVAWLNADGHPSSSWRYSKEERSALDEKKDELKQALVP